LSRDRSSCWALEPVRSPELVTRELRCAPSSHQAPIFDGILSATIRAVVDRRGRIEFVWVRE
jgi:hypothetical protein